MRKWMKNQYQVHVWQREGEREGPSYRTKASLWVIGTTFSPFFLSLSSPPAVHNHWNNQRQKFRIIICDCFSRYYVRVWLWFHFFTLLKYLYTHHSVCRGTLSVSLALSLCFCLDSHPLSTLCAPPTLLSVDRMLGWAWMWQSDAVWSWSSKATLTSVLQCWLVREGNLFFFFWISVGWKASQASEA